MSLDETTYLRTIYGFFDWLGDVGGLNDMLFLLGGQIFAFISYFVGSGLNRYLIYNIFMTEEPKHKRSKLYSNDVMEHINKRVPLRVRICKWFAGK